MGRVHYMGLNTYTALQPDFPSPVTLNSRNKKELIQGVVFSSVKRRDYWL
jgi:hypothetical protein